MANKAKNNRRDFLCGYFVFDILDEHEVSESEPFELDFDDDEDWEEAISVELNKIISNDSLKNLSDFQEIFLKSP